MSTTVLLKIEKDLTDYISCQIKKDEHMSAQKTSETQHDYISDHGCDWSVQIDKVKSKKNDTIFKVGLLPLNPKHFWNFNVSMQTRGGLQYGFDLGTACWSTFSHQLFKKMIFLAPEVFEREKRNK